ncbi:MAG: insulinase family protein [Desulfobacterales bacterium]|nr:insulinase family protein [Desulfobacterales bacterium]
MKRKVIFILFVLLFAANAFSQNIEKLAPWPHENNDLSPDPKVIFKRLDNGFRYVLMENHEPKNRVSMHLNIQIGSMHESDEEQGVAHFLEHMVFCGSTHFKPGELVKYFQRIGMEFGPDANGHTSFYETVYDLILPDGKKETIEEGLTVMKDYAYGALLLPSEIEREKKVILAEKTARDSASYRTFIETLKFEAPDSKISKREPIGKEETIKKADQNTLKGFYDNYYRPEKFILVMVGDFDVNIASKIIEDRFKGLSPRTAKFTEPDFGKIEHKGIKGFYHYEKEEGNTSLSIETTRLVSPVNGNFAFEKELIIQDIADKIIQTRLNDMISGAKAPFTSAMIDSGLFLNRIKYANISARCSPEKWDKALSSIEQVLRRALSYGFTQGELDRVKKDFQTMLDTNLKKAQTRNSREIAREIIGTLNSNRVFQSPQQEKDLFSPVINALTLEDVHNSLKKTWEADHRLILVTGNAKISKTSDIIDVFNKSNDVKVSPIVEETTIKFPYLSDPENYGKIIKRKDIKEFGIIQIDFENGIRLNLKKTDFKAQEVSVNISFGYGKSSQPLNSPGLSYLTTEIINESGFGKYKKSEIHKALSGKNIAAGFSIGDAYFLLSGKTISKEVPLLFQVLYTYLMDPGYREEAYNLSIERFKQQYEELSRNIEGAMEISGKSFLSNYDPRIGLPAYEKLIKLKIKDVKSWIAPIFKHEPLEITIVGDFDTELTIKLASKYFGSLPKRYPISKPILSTLPHFPEAKTFNIKVPTEIDKGMVIVTYPTEDFWDITRNRCFNVLSGIVSERLREKIREKLGATYSPYAYNQGSKAYPGYGLFGVVVSINPKDADMVTNEVKKLIVEFNNSKITDDELRRVIDPIITSIKEMVRTNDYWLQLVLTDSRKHPEQIEWAHTIMKGYRSITKENVLYYAKKYLNNDKARTVTILPQDKGK